MTKQFKVIVEKHPDGYVAYPLGLKGVVVGEGDIYEEALVNVKVDFASVWGIVSLPKLNIFEW